MAEEGGISGVGVAAVFAGGILVWSGIKGYSVSGTFRDLIAGKSPAKQTAANPVSASGIFGPIVSALNPVNLLSSGGTSTTASVTSTGGSVSGTNAQNKALGQRMAAAAGWTGAQWTALNNIVMAESGWSSTIKNPTSSASGIAQNINGFGPGYQYGNAAQQIAWLINYIKTRYGTPVAAWQFHLANGWY
jgi:hypothetical protein